MRETAIQDRALRLPQGGVSLRKSKLKQFDMDSGMLHFFFFFIFVGLVSKL